MVKVNCEYKIKEDIGFFMEAERINKLELSDATKISRSTFEAIEKRGTSTDEVCEKLYAHIYKQKYRLNSVKEELIKEKYDTKDPLKTLNEIISGTEGVISPNRCVSCLLDTCFRWHESPFDFEEMDRLFIKAAKVDNDFNYS